MSIIERVKKGINYAKDPAKSYGGVKYEYGYHTITIEGKLLQGQRDNYKRLSKIPYDFSNKVVLDIGCGAGGILHAVSNKIKYGIGIDRNFRLINLANIIKYINQYHNLSFYTFDVEKEPLQAIDMFLYNYDKVDMVFFLSMAKWVGNWRDVVLFCKTISEMMVFESNGIPKFQIEQESFLKKNYKNVTLISESSDDDPKQKNRRLFICGE